MYVPVAVAPQTSFLGESELHRTSSTVDLLVWPIQCSSDGSEVGSDEVSKEVLLESL
jgi:hypothetical protein